MLELYFKTDERARGEALVRSVSIKGSSDSGIRAFVDNSKVTLVSVGIDSPTFTASCTCASGRKGRLCAHIWAVLKKSEGSDFLVSKTEIEGVSPPGNEFRKQQAARHKEYLRKQREVRKERAEKQEAAPVRGFAYPQEVEEALAYFAANGFKFESLDLENLMHAKKLLSRVFHPDKGGSHEEVIELNLQFDVVADYLSK